VLSRENRERQPDPNPFMNRVVMPAMCGRFGLFSPAEILVAKFGIKETTMGLTPRYNVAPEQDIAVIIQNDAR
jgi:hypothetical protein